jgi:hypothetical protein
MAALLLAYPVWYSIGHWSESAFRDAVVAGWFSTVVGVIVGVPTALQLARAQQKSQDRVEAARAVRQLSEERRILRERLLEEVSFNHDAVAALQEVLARGKSARADLWKWASTIADSFEFVARFDVEKVIAFRTSGAQLQDVPFYLAYRDLKRLLHMVTQSGAAHDFFYGYSADEAAANRRLEDVRHFAGVVARQLVDAAKMLRQATGD